MVYSVPFLKLKFKGIKSMKPLKPLLLLILDGWGYTADSKYNAIKKAHTPQWDSWLKQYPNTVLDACGESVGLPHNQIGNSEVGHMHIGAGRIILQDFSQINADIENNSFYNNKILTSLCADTATQKTTLHLMGLLSPGGVHSHENHLFAFLKIAAQNGQPNTAIHLFLDGRDTPPKSALGSIEKLESKLKHYPFAKIVSMCGRFYAMDRDKRWDRIQETYDLLTLGNKSIYPTAKAALLDYYDKGITDEFTPACSIGLNPTTIQDQDNIFFFNFRADRAIQLTECFILPNFDAFPQKNKPTIHLMVTMVPYSDHLHTIPVYPKHHITNTIGEMIEKAGFKQLRVAETEKFPHVTYFLNGGREEPFEHEDRILIPSPKVRTYNLQPEMRVEDITQIIIDHLATQKYQFIIANFANPDMVGHCGEFEATVTAIEAVDKCFQKLNIALEKYNTQAIITADHGNAEIMFDELTQQKHTAHTMSPVPFLFIGKNCQLTKTHGSLVDIAPTILELLHMKKPIEMTGNSLLTTNHANE
jgi:2,3-bisphosphoglycerate-independent phosphoglycerate mutase